MVCKKCSIFFFNNPPCEDGVISNVTELDNSLKILIKVLNENCPCKECIVKMVCKEYNRCSKRNEFLTVNEKKVLNATAEKFRTMRDIKKCHV